MMKLQKSIIVFTLIILAVSHSLLAAEGLRITIDEVKVTRDTEGFLQGSPDVFFHFAICQDMAVRSPCMSVSSSEETIEVGKNGSELIGKTFEFCPLANFIDKGNFAIKINVFDNDSPSAPSNDPALQGVDLMSKGSLANVSLDRIRSARPPITIENDLTLQGGGPISATFRVIVEYITCNQNNLISFDTNGSCELEDPEFFAAADSWIDGQSGDALFFDAVDAWIGQQNICSNSNSATFTSIVKNNIAVQRSLSEYTFIAQKTEADQLSVEIYNLSGQSLHRQHSSSNRLSWNLSDDKGRKVANGVYLYQAEFIDKTGNVIDREIRKFIVLR